MYVASYFNSEISFCVDVVASKVKPQVDYTSIDFAFGDVAPDLDYSRVNTKHPIRVAANVIKFVYDVISKYKPYYFKYAANDADKVRAYKMAAKKIANKCGYDVQVVGQTFNFYKKLVD